MNNTLVKLASCCQDTRTQFVDTNDPFLVHLSLLCEQVNCFMSPVLGRTILLKHVKVDS